jgi:hypothetical protein
MGQSCALSAVERQKIQQWIAAHGTPRQVAMRCRIVLAAAEGESNVAIAERLSANRNTVILWRKRFDEEGLDGLLDIAPGRGRKPKYQIDKIAAIVRCDATNQAGGDDALELPHHGGESGLDRDGRPDLEPPSASRSDICGESGK